MKFGKSILGDYHQGTFREYLLTNGRGGYCCGSINGNNARQYHGLLIHSFRPPLDRYLTLHKAEESINGISLACSHYLQEDKEVFREGYHYLDSFTLAPLPVWHYSAAGTFIRKEICLPHDRELVILKYTVLSSIQEKTRLQVDLFFNYRNTEEVTPAPAPAEIPGRYRLSLADQKMRVSFDPAQNNFFLYIKSDSRESKLHTVGPDDSEAPLVQSHILYDIDHQHRGETRLDSSYRFARAEAQLAAGESFYIIGSMEEEQQEPDPEQLISAELERIKTLREAVPGADPLRQDLALAADAFIVHREGTGGKTIIAGYPWFGDWGRDTMIALPGLTLATRRFEDARSILLTFARYCSQGMLPNKFPDYEGQELMYNTIDVSLWYFYAVQQYLDYTGDYTFIGQHIFQALEEIVRSHIAGTRYGIKVDYDGLLTGGNKDTQLTWMDVKYDGWAVTPRFGKAVEINALWYHALRTMVSLAAALSKNIQLYSTHAEMVEQHFERAFWYEAGGYLYDYITEDEKNRDIRPNQIYAVSLAHTLLDKEKNKKIVDKVTQLLYTPHGLRSLSAENPQYQGTYQGNLFQRDSVYHQGTVWSHLMGHFINAYQNVYGPEADTALFLQGLQQHFYEAGCIRSVSEIFDGDPPYQARGCFAQAWSVGELLRILDRDAKLSHL